MGPERREIDPSTQVVEFLSESNHIENVWDQDSLNQALEAWDYLSQADQLSVEAVLQTHKILMTEKLDPKNLGAFRKHGVRIGGREGKPWYLLPELVENWIRLVNETVNKSISDEDIIREQHISFEIIHPFADGNGRMGRILMNWTRIKVGLPILIVKEREKQAYHRWFLVGDLYL